VIPSLSRTSISECKGEQVSETEMFTDTPPRRASLQAEYLASDQHIDLAVPQDDRLRGRAKAIEAAMEAGKPAALLYACSDFLAVASDFYNVQKPGLRVLAARPLRVREGGGSMELFGDYNPGTILIRVWMRTAVRRQITSFGTFFSTLCHEFCHHLDCRRLGFRGSPHTRGFYQRTAVLYHHARGTPVKKLVWVKMPRGRWRIDWRRMKSESVPKVLAASS
jgi:hypothetical protein